MSTKEITEKTALPISLIIVVASVLIWGVRLEGRVDANERVIKDQRDDQTEFNRTVKSIDIRLSHIEGKLGLNSRQ